MGRWVEKDGEHTFLGEPCPHGHDGAGGGAGSKGDKGDPGKDGADGLPGADGKDGKDGLPGADGKDGADAGDSPHDHDDYLPLAGGTVTGDLTVDGTSTLKDGAYLTGPLTVVDQIRFYGKTKIPAGSSLAIEFSDTGSGFYGNAGGVSLLVANNPRMRAYPERVEVFTDLKVNGTINGQSAFGIAEGIDTADVLDRAETATMPVVDEEGVATADVDVESLTVNEVVTALLAKVKQQSEQIADLSERIEVLEAHG